MIMPVATDEDGRMDVRAGEGEGPSVSAERKWHPKLHVECRDSLNGALQFW